MAAVLDWTWVRVQLSCPQAKVWPQSANSCHREVTVCTTSKPPKQHKFDILRLFSFCQTKKTKQNKKKRLWKVIIHSNFPHTTLSCLATNKTVPATFSPYMDEGTPPPLPSERSGSGELTYTVTWLLGLKVRVFVPHWLVQLPPLQCHYSPSVALVAPGKLLLSGLPCPSAGRTGRLCPGENTRHFSGAPCIWQLKESRSKQSFSAACDVSSAVTLLTAQDFTPICWILQSLQ